MHIRIGTRKSALALTQTNLVATALKAKHPDLTLEIIEMVTQGDKKQGTPLAHSGDKKDWVYELECALLNNTIDIAIHSGKDVPGNIEPGTTVIPVLSRESPADVFIGKLDHGGRGSFPTLPQNATVGTSSLRRKASLLRLRTDLSLIDHRGNVPTRIKKLDESATLHGIVLAEAGLNRLGLKEPFHRFSTYEVTPALNQGILAVQIRSDDTFAQRLSNSISSDALKAVFNAERRCAEILQGDCNSCIGIYAEIKLDSTLKLFARVLSHDGKQCIEYSHAAQIQDAASIGEIVGEKLCEMGARNVLS